MHTHPTEPTRTEHRNKVCSMSKTDKTKQRIQTPFESGTQLIVLSQIEWISNGTLLICIVAHTLGPVRPIPQLPALPTPSSAKLHSFSRVFFYEVTSVILWWLFILWNIIVGIGPDGGAEKKRNERDGLFEMSDWRWWGHHQIDLEKEPGNLFDWPQQWLVVCNELGALLLNGQALAIALICPCGKWYKHTHGICTKNAKRIYQNPSSRIWFDGEFYGIDL